MAGKKEKKKKPAPEAPAEDGVAAEEGGKPKGSKKMLFAAIGLCLLSLGGGFFFARMAYMQDAETYEPDYIAEDGDHEEMNDDHGDDYAKDDHGEKKGDDYDKKDKKGKGKKKAELRDDIKDPLAKDGHDAEQALALQKKEKGGKDDHGEEYVDNGMLEFGDMLTNIAGTDLEGRPKTSFLKVNLVMAYRTDPGAAALMREREAFMRDLFNGYLRGLSETDVQGMAGILYVKAELLKRARAAAGNDLPQEILIKDLIVQ